MSADFDERLGAAWKTHADDPAGAAAQVGSALLAAVSSSADLMALAHLGHHLWGAHLNQPPGGLSLLQDLRAHPACDADALAALARYRASLLLTHEQPQALDGLPDADQTRAMGLAAANLAEVNPARASQLLQAAAARVPPLTTPPGDPMARAVAVAGNNIAAAMEEVPRQTPAQRDMMILAARTARTYWAIAGGWLEVERAEYRLSNSWRVAGNAAQARQHAQACLALVAQHQAPPLERFFALEALALAAHAAADLSAHADACQQAALAFESLDADDQTWCRATLERLQTLN